MDPWKSSTFSFTNSDDKASFFAFHDDVFNGKDEEYVPVLAFREEEMRPSTAVKRICSATENGTQQKKLRYDLLSPKNVPEGGWVARNAGEVDVELTTTTLSTETTTTTKQHHEVLNEKLPIVGKNAATEAVKQPLNWPQGTAARAGGIRNTPSSQVGPSKRLQSPRYMTTPDALQKGLQTPAAVKKAKSLPERTTPKSKGLQSHQTKTPASPYPQLFSGLTLYFIPNARSGSRKARMDKAEQFGAVIANEWSEAVTHIVVDAQLPGSVVLKVLGMEHLPFGVNVVKSTWTPNCIMMGRIVRCDEAQYVVEGLLTETPVSTRSQPESDRSLQLKPPRQRKQAVLSQHSTSISSEEFPTPRKPTGGLMNNPMRERMEVTTTDVQAKVDKPLDALDAAIAEAMQLPAALDLEDDGSGCRLSLSSKSSKDEEDEEGAGAVSGIPATPKWQANFQCMHANTGKDGDNPNEETVEILSKMQKYYEDTKDNWRAIGYRKAITSLKKEKTFIATAEQASKLPGVGTRIAEKIEEIVATGRLQRLESTDNTDDNAKRLLAGIYGVGPVQAQKWVQAGIKTLQDVLDRGKPTYDQKVGIKYYDELSEKMPRWEAAAISRLVIDEARAIDPELELHTMGSFRRGAEKCGDVDIIITKPNVQIPELRGVLTKLTKNLRIRKVITHDLAVAHDTDGSKWMGIAKRTDPDAKHRRLDILLVPWKELGAALLYFTGNDIFNRSIRLLAKKRGMRLNQHGLFRDGELIVSETEEQIFDALGVPFRPPHERIP
ncbi:hypothetical protein YB2330_001202 [Saitoella coloradoensis]